MTTAQDFRIISLWRKLRGASSRLWDDTRGAVLFYITATLPALIGFSLLAIDASRLTSLHTSLQKGVDALAIAGAGELDRAPGAINRANIAVDNLLNNYQVFGQGAAAIDRSNVTLRFLTNIPDNQSGQNGLIGDALPIPANMVVDTSATNADRIARFIEVTVDTYNLNAIFPASFVGGVNSALAQATAVAGNDQVVCRLAPMFICNPWEAANNNDVHNDGGLFAAVTSSNPAQRRRLIAARQGPGAGSSADWFPGNFGFLDMGSGAVDLAEAIAAGNDDACFVQNGVDTEPGQMEGPVRAAINTRFALYDNPFFGNGAGSAKYRPGANVRKGQAMVPGPGNSGPVVNCSTYTPEPNPTNTAQALPRPTCFNDHSCNTNGTAWRVEPAMTQAEFNAQVSTYWANNGLTAAGFAVPTPGTRWDLYNHELDTANVVPHAAPNTETGSPSCYNNNSAPAERNRRLIGVAVINCRALSPLNGAQDNLPVLAFGEFLITEPVAAATGRNIYIELVNIVQQGNGIVVNNFDQVQLYR